MRSPYEPIAAGRPKVARSTAWGLAQITGLAAGALTERALVGFLAPLPPGVDIVAKITQSIVVMGLVMGLVMGVVRSALHGARRVVIIAAAGSGGLR